MGLTATPYCKTSAVICQRSAYTAGLIAPARCPVFPIAVSSHRTDLATFAVTAAAAW